MADFLRNRWISFRHDRLPAERWFPSDSPGWSWSRADDRCVVSACLMISRLRANRSNQARYVLTRVPLMAKFNSGVEGRRRSRVLILRHASGFVGLKW